MSIVYCEECDKNIDTDFNAEHFEEHEFTTKDFEILPGVYADEDGFIISKEEAQETADMRNRRFKNG